MDPEMAGGIRSLITDLPETKILRRVRLLNLHCTWSDRERRKAAESELERMGHEALPSLISLMGVSGKANVKSRRAVWVFLALLSALLIAAWLTPAKPGEAPHDLFRFLVLLLPFLLLAWIMLRSDKASQLTTSELHLLLKVSDRRSIPTLIDLHAHLFDTDQQWQIRKRITELLPALDATDCQSLASLYVCRLVRLINGRWSETCDVQFAVAVLSVCGQFGNGETVPIVRALARSAQSERIRDAARECLPVLFGRNHRQRAGSGLLRAAAAVPAPEILVRASAPGVAPQSELIRGYQGGSENYD
jgi:hypothetical protein